MKYLLLFTVFIAFTHCGGRPGQAGASSEWRSLFNGKDINDWIVKIHHHETGVNFGNTFRAEDGMIKVRYDQYGAFNDQFGHLYYKQTLLALPP